MSHDVDAASRVGIIGLGSVGSAAARALLRGGYTVLGFQRSEASHFADLGGEVAASVNEVFRRCEKVILALPTAEALEHVVRSGTEDRSEKTMSCSLAIDISAIDIASKERARIALDASGIGMLDAPVGGSPDSEPGFVSVFASGDEHLYRPVEPLLRTLAERVWYLGGFGAGSAMKMVNLAVVAMHTVAAAEALRLGTAAGIDKDVLIDVLGNSPASSWVIRDRAHRLVDGPYLPPRGSVSALRGALLGVHELSSRSELDLPLFRAAMERYEQAMARGLGSHDVTSVYSLY